MASSESNLVLPHQVVFIDSNVPDLQDLLNGLQPGEIAFVLDASSDGVQQIADILAANDLTDLTSISIVGHGSSGAIDLGSTVLDDADLSSHAAALTQIGAALAPGGDLQLYSCNTASGVTGQQFIADLSSYVGGATVAASTQDIGQTATGENWSLDAVAGPAADQSGSIAAPTQVANPFTAKAEAQFSGTLTVPTSEVWIVGSAFQDANIILHDDDTGTHTVSNQGELFTPTSANNPSSANNIDRLDMIRLDTQNQKYFIGSASEGAAPTELLEGSLSSVLASPTATPTYTTLWKDTSSSRGSNELSGLALDPASQQVFFVDGTSFYKNGYNGNTSSVTTLDNTGNVFIEGLALDLPDHVAYFIHSFQSNTTTTTKNGVVLTSAPSPITSHEHVHHNVTQVNSIYETSSSTPLSASTTSVSLTKLMDVAPSLGTMANLGTPGFTVYSQPGNPSNPLNGKIFFTTETIGGTHPAEGGVFELNPSTQAITTLFRQDGVHGPTGILTSLQIDYATNQYYVTVINTGGTGGTIWVGSLSGGTPTQFDTLAGQPDNPTPFDLSVDAAPTLSITPTSPTFTESTSNPASANNTPVSLLTSATGGDSDNTELVGASVSVGGFFTGDKLSFSNNNNITGSYNSSTGVLTFSGLDTFAHYQTALATVDFTSTSDNPTDYGSDTARTLSFAVNDGLLYSAAQTETVTVVGVNDPPTLTGTSTANFTEKGGAKPLSSGASVFDVDSLTFGGATVSITGGTFAGDGDVLAASTTGTTITATYNSTSETLVLSGSDTLAHYQTVLDAVTFNSTSLNPDDYGSQKTRTVTWQLNDGSGSFNLSTVVTSTLNVTAVNDPPTLTGTTGTVSFTEGQAVTLSSAASVSDPDNLTLAGATVKIAGGTFANDGDVLATSTVGTSITASYNSSTETLTLSGSDTLADYQTVLDKVAFSSGSNPDDYGSQKTRTVTWVLNDGSGSFNLSTAATTTVNVTAINDPPVLTSVAPSVTYIENASPVTLAATAQASDVDSLTLANATVQIVGGTFAGDGDVLAASTAGTSITASYNSTTETLVLSGSDSLAHYQQVLDHVTFSTPSDNPDDFGADPTRTVTWVLNDGAGSNNLSSVTTTTINVTAVNDPPTLAVAASKSFTENAGPIVLSSAVTVSDPDNQTWVGATVQVAGGTFAGDGDVLAADTTGTAITASYNSTSETLTLTGTDTLADYQQVLQSVTFVTASHNPTDYGSNPTRTVTWVVNDGSGSFNLSTAQTETVSLTAVNDPPTLSNVASSASYTELGTVAVLSSTLAVSDPDNLTLAGATVKIVGGTFANDGDVLAAATTGTSITASYNSTSETLTLSGSDTLAHYQQVLDSVSFSSTSHNPDDFGSNPTRTVTWVINDGSGSSNLSSVATTTVTLTAVNDPPTLTGTTNASFTENGAATTLSPSVTVADPDNQALAGATVQIAGGTFAADGDLLATSTAGTSITASYNSTSETLTLSGTDTLAHYQQVLDHVTFSTPSHNPTDFGSDPTRTVIWVLNDGSGSNNLSTAQTSTIAITAVDDPPTLSAVASSVTYSAGTTVTVSSLAAVSDPDNLDLASATVSITGGTFVGDGDVLGADTTGTSITASYNSTSETLTLTGSDTLANYQTVLDSVTFSSTAVDPSNGGANLTRTLSWVANDGTLSSAPQITTVSIQSGPAVNPPANASFTENQASPVTLAPALVVTDPNTANLISATVALTGGTFAGDGDLLNADTTGTNVTASYDSTNEILTLSGSDTLANYQSVLDTVTFTTPSENPTDFGSDPSRTVTWTVVDDSGTTNNTGTATSTIAITAINDAPTVTADASVAFTEGNTTPLSPTLSVTDVDSLGFVGATVSITGGTFAGDGDVLSADTTGTSITASYSSTSETLTLSGSDTVADYQQVLDTVSFASGHNPDDYGSSPTRTVSWVVDDGGATNNLSAAVATTIDITAINDPPTITAAASDSFKTGQTITLSPTLAVTDPDNLDLASATVSVAGSFAGDGDVLGVDTTGTSITASYDSTNEILTLTGSDTLAHYQQVLDTVTFSSGTDPTNSGSNPTRTISWVANDGTAASTPQTTTVNLQLGPALLVPASAAFTENTASTTLAPTVALSDSNPGASILSATVALTGGTFAGDGDLLNADTTGTNVTASYDSTNEILTLSGSDTLANYQSVLDTVTFTTPSENPTDFGSDPSRTVAWTVLDDSGTTNNTGTATSTIAITAINDAPTVTADASVAFTEGNTTPLSPTLSVTDVDSLGFVGATVSITGGTFAGDGDVLSADTTGTSITASYSSTSETLTLSGSDTVADYQQVLDTVSFASGHNPDDYGSSPTRTVSWVVDDGGATNNLSAAVATTIDITAINDPPTITAAASVAFTLGQTVTVSPTVSVSDPDSLDLASAFVKISGGTFAGDGDVLAADTTGTSITASYNSTSETLTLTGSDTLAHYQQVLDTVTFASGPNPNNGGADPTRTISWLVDDGSASNHASALADTTVDIAHIPPTLSNVAATIAFTQGNNTVLSPSITVTDLDSTTLSSATVSITGGTFAGDGDVLGFSTAGTSISASYNAATETLTLTGNDTLVHYQTVLDSVKFSSGSDPTNHGSDKTRTVSWVVNDGSATNGLSAAQDSTITITPLDAAPTLSHVAASASFTENASPVLLSSTLSVSDPDSTSMTSATVQITGGTFAGDGDVLAANTAGTSITASYNSTSETLSLTGSDTLAHYQQVLDSVTFVTPSDNPTDFGADPKRIVTWTVADDFAVASAPATTTVNLTAVNDPPTLSSVSPTVAFTAGTSVALSPTLSVSDPDNLNLAGATVQIVGGTFANDGDVLTANTAGTHITASYNSTTETLTLTGSDPVATYQSVLDSVMFASGANPADFGSNPTRTVTWVVNDGSGSNNLSTIATTTVDISTINNPPVLTNVAATVAFTEGQQLTVSGAATVTDSDNIDLADATVKVIGGAFAGDGDVLAVTTTGTTITASYNSTSETLVLTGSDTVAHYQQVLDSLTFASGLNPDDYGSQPTRVLTWLVDDGSASNNLSTVATTTISITAINNPPTLTGTANAAFTEGAAAVTLSPSVTVSDPDSLSIAGATVQVTGGTFAGDGDVLAADTTGTAITASYNSSNETLTLSGTDTFADYQQVLDTVTFVTPSHNPTDFGSAPTRTIAWTLNDGSASNATSTVTTTVSVTGVNDPPTLSGTANASFTEKGAATTLSGAASVSDPDNLNLASATVAITAGTFVGDGDVLAFSVAGTSITASYNSSTETLVLSGSDTLAHYQQVLDGVTFNSTSLNPTDYGSAPTRTVTWTLNDGSASFATTAVTTTVSLTAVNDPPTLTSVAGTGSFTENGSAVTASPNITVSDPDNLTLVGATVSIGNGFAGDGDVLGFNTAGTGISGSYNSTTETLILTGFDTLAHYGQVLDSVTFSTPSHNPTDYGSSLSRVLTWIVNDGSASSNLSAAQFTTVVITAVNDPPTLSNVAAAAHLQVGHSVTLSPSVAVSDPDNLTLAGATVAVTGGAFAGDGDVLGFSTAGTSITASYNSTSETLTLSGSDSLAHYQQVLDSVTFASGANPSDSGSNPTRTVTWVLNDGSGSFNLSTAATTTVSFVTSVQDDFNGDQLSDLMFTQHIPAQPGTGISEWQSTGNSFTPNTFTGSVGDGWTLAGLGDFNGDLKSDLLWQNGSTFTEWQSTGNGFTPNVFIGSVAPGWSLAAVADFSGDGKADLLWQNGSTFTEWQSTGNGFTPNTFVGSVAPGWTLAAVGDFNGDGKSDLIWQNGSTFTEWQSTGSGFTANTFVGSVAPGWSLAAVGDFSGDGKSDLLWQNGSTFTEWQSTGSGFTPNTFVGSVAPGWTVASVGDFNGDQKSDLIWQNGTTFTEWQSTGSGFTPNTFVGSVGQGTTIAGNPTTHTHS